MTFLSATGCGSRRAVRTFVDNDANVAALGEAMHGAGRVANPVFWVNAGSAWAED